MTTDDYILKHIGHASRGESEWFERYCGDAMRKYGPINGLGRNGKPMPMGAGPHCVGWWTDIAWCVGSNRNVLEIGFCIGLSARIILETVAQSGKLVSVDPSDHEECLSSANDLESNVKFQFFYGKSEKMFSATGMPEFNLAFIDGDHEYDSIITDIKVCRHLGIKTMVFDDWHPHFGPHTQRAVIDSGLRVRAIFGNYALCEDDL